MGATQRTCFTGRQSMYREADSLIKDNISPYKLLSVCWKLLNFASM